MQLPRRWLEPSQRNNVSILATRQPHNGNPLTTVPEILQLSPIAQQFLAGMKEVGIIDDVMEGEVLNRMMLECSGEIGLDGAKRAVATVVFEHQFDLHDEYFGIFEEEWKLLFN